MTQRYLACDLGAESGRLMLGALHENRLTLEEIHRFPNTPVKSGESLHWDIPKLFSELKVGLKKAAALGVPVASISCDSWGVDYLLFAEDGSLICPSFHYRDPRSKRGVEKAYGVLDWKTIFAETGIQFMALNTIFQLAAEDRSRLEQARHILGVGDGFNYLLSGRPWIEVSMASTFQLYNPCQRDWSDSLISALRLPRKAFPRIVRSGTRLGPIRPEISAEAGLGNIEVIAGCSHDTGAAVAAVPRSSQRWAYLSSGTWSLMGVELEEPIINDTCRELNFTNEIGYNGTVRLLKNIIGLWIVQECRRDWERAGENLDYDLLTTLAAEARPHVSLIDPADPRFLAPDNMLMKVSTFCLETNQPVPETPGSIIRCVLESLALLYQRTLLQLEQLVGWKIECLHIVGGGGKNALLNEFTAHALQIPVLVGPIEATAAGNILIQAISLGHVDSLRSARCVVQESFPITRIEPDESKRDIWEQAYGRLNALACRKGG